MSKTVRPCRKIYSQSQIGLWLNRINRDWERLFDSESLELGRGIYRDGKIHVVELNRQEAIISAKLDDGSTPYSVLDFDDNGDFSPRCSDSDSLISSSLAAAGMYEIEEIVGDAISSEEFLEHPEDFERIHDRAAQKTEISPDGEILKKNNDDDKSLEENEEIELFDENARRIVLDFSSKKKGLIFNSVWLNKEGKTRKVFGENALEVDKLTNAERENLVRLASLARKAGFRYDGDSYLMSDISKIPQFVSSTMRQWNRYFDITKDANVDLLALGERTVMIQSYAHEEREGDTFSIEWKPVVGSVKIDSADLSRLVASSGALNIVPSCGIVRVTSDDGAFVRRVEATRETSNGKIPRYILLSLGDFGARLELSHKLRIWLNSLMKARAIPDAELPQFLRKYQKHGVSWAANLFKHGCGAMIADEMGLGKTVQTLALISRYFEDTDEAKKKKKFLVVCPASVIPVWGAEAKKFFPNISSGVLSSDSNLEDASLWIASYTQLRRNKKLLEKVNFELAALDEAQFIKNPDAKTTAACMSICAKRKIALTGTPLENKPLDLWSAFRWLMPGLMGSRSNFERLVESGASAAAIIRRQISPFVLRRLKSEVASELPEKIYVDLACPMNPLQRSEYSKLLTSAREELKVASAATNGKMTVLSLLTRLRQAACDATLLPWVGENVPSSDISEKGGKISILLDKVEELFSSGKKILIFSQFVKFLDIMHREFEAKIGAENILTLTGSTRDRAKPVEEFQNRKGATLMLVSLRAGGTGITLTSADYVFIADPWWNPAVEEQAIDRVHRIGRKGDVFVYRMIAQDTVEERVRQLQSKKRRLFDELLGGLKDVSARDKFVETVSDILS